MKPETDYRNISKSWLKADGHEHFLAAMLLAFLAIQASYWCGWCATREMWIHSVLLAILAPILWTRTVTTAMHAAKCLMESNK